MANITVVGAGLAGAEAAWQLCERGHQVTLREMKPQKHSPAHQRDSFAELVCSNSLRSDRLENAVGLLKEELRALDSLILACADATRVPAGGALAVDREGFTQLVTKKLLSHKNLTYIPGEVEDIPDAPCIIATGPLTSGTLYERIGERVGAPLHFYDAAAPIVAKDSLDFSKVFAASRYGRGEDYLNCPMTKEEYFTFYHALITAETAQLHSFETPRVFEGCMPVEVMAKRGEMTLAYGPLKPVGLEVEGKMPFAVVQLRQDDAKGQLYNIVGFQTNLKFGEQKRVFSLIPGLQNAEFVRYGVMHRNSFLPSPGVLNWDYSLRSNPLICFAGQMTGVEGYVESASSGLMAALSLHEKLLGREPVDFTDQTAIGALGHYVSEYAGKDFQPMNVTFGIMAPAGQRFRGKQQKNLFLSQRALEQVKTCKSRLSAGI
ncbi:MAG: methylenetetrahydrofolate--tRNA-(uracil(54)-C(5))-methyltransferase (FADH(2)-oxidizing) TrmFO [Clostridia bacterium]|nr:methylenetetrahydrofolate--tRNA-(uracil(54)-C(5))-methyltransferase (FADH(2)-oxidizing) TrmFO [Clostridia bacterium]